MTYRNERIEQRARCDPCAGRLRWRPEKTAWYLGMWVGWLVGGVAYFSWQAVGVCLAFCAVTLCFGHSLGMHRLLIHRSFACPAWMERAGVYLGTLVGLGGPFTMMWTHDLRDWAQRQRHCHPFFGHRAPLWRDWWWQLHCRIELDHPPAFRFPGELAQSGFYRLLERTAPLQQLPWALLLFVLGGWGWVAWGICGRVATSMTGHWLVGHFAHRPRPGPLPWRVSGAAVQGVDVPFCGLVTFGECWHNNHHAFPGSARLGFGRRQADPGWWVLTALARFGLAWDVKLPADLPPRPELVRGIPPTRLQRGRNCQGIRQSASRPSERSGPERVSGSRHQPL